MSAITRVLLPAVFVSALFGVGASSASALEAPFYELEGARLKASETREAGLTGGTQKLVSTNAGITITCTAVKAQAGATIIGSGANEPGTSSGKLEYTGCRVEGNGTTCVIPGEKIVTNALKDELVLNAEAPVKGTKILDLFKPASGSVFATINFEGTCKFSETTVEGSTDAEVQNSKAETVGFELHEKEEVSGFLKSEKNGTKECKFAKGALVKCTTSSLKAFGVASTLEGTAEAFLTGADAGKKLGVFSKGGGGGEEGEVKISPTSYNYGSVKTGQKATETFTVSTAATSAEIDPTGFGVKTKAVKGSGDFTVSSNGCKQVTITPGSPCAIKVAFEPTKIESYESNLEVKWQISGGFISGTARATLTGSGGF
jgi:hypothetical protein